MSHKARCRCLQPQPTPALHQPQILTTLEGGQTKCVQLSYADILPSAETKWAAAGGKEPCLSCSAVPLLAGECTSPMPFTPGLSLPEQQPAFIPCLH